MSGEAGRDVATATVIRGRYEVLGTLGSGGEAHVVKALDRQHDRLVALKIRRAHDEDARRELLNEARVLLAIPPHPALPLVREDFFEGDRYVIAMDWVDGTDLAVLLAERGRPGLAPSSVLAYLAEAADALTHLHSQDPPVIHGDVKPANLILTRGGRVKLVDFGMSSAPGAVGRRAGTPGFRAPELATSGSPSRASDVYALAATAFALLSGAPPAGVLPAWEGIDPEQAAQLEAALRLGLATDPGRRPSTPGELVERLRTGWAEALPTGVMTFCLSDIEGSTALWDADPRAMAEALVRHDEIITEQVEARGGRVLKSMGEGDSTVSVFASAPAALEAAVAATRAMGSEKWPSAVQISVRFGLHTGEAERRGGDYFGPTLNLAARLRGQAAGGEILLSSTTAAVVGSHLPAGCETMDLGPHRLRGVREPERIHAVTGPGISAPPPPGDCPYRGLLSFEPADRRWFFGREAAAADVLARVAPGRLLAVIGASGSGKSSLLRAGIVAAVRAGEVEGLDEAHVITPGSEPQLDVADDPREVVVVDQFEELYTLCEDDARRDAFIERLLSLRSAVVIGVRADLYGRLSSSAALARAVAGNQVLLGPMTRDQLERAIVEPARRAGLRLEPGLVDVILGDVAREPGALPLLSHALRVTWERRDGRTLTVDGYRASGGVSSAIARTADAVVETVPPERQGLMRDLFLRLTELGEGTEDTRRRVPVDELVTEGRSAGEVQALLDRLAEARLLTLGDGTAEVAHEVLIREWPRLRAWLEEDRAGIRLHRQLGNAARTWDAGGREAADLYRGGRLAAAVEWARERPSALNVVERAFLDASVAEADRERRAQVRANRRLRALLAGVGALAAVAVVAGGIALREGGEAREQALVADAQRLGAEALTDERLDHGLLLARAGVALHDSTATRSNLLAALLRNPAAIGVMRGDGDRLQTAALTADGRTLAVADNDGTVTLVDTASRRRVGEYRAPEPAPSFLEFSPDGRRLVVSTWGAADVVDVRTRRRLVRIPTGEYPGDPAVPIHLPSVAFLPGGRRLVVAYLPDGPPAETPPAVLRHADARTGALSRPVRIGRHATTPRIMVTGDRRTLFVGTGLDETRSVDARTLRPRRRVPFTAWITAVSPDGRLMALGGEDGSVRVADLRSRRSRRLSGRHDAPVQGAAFSPDGRTLITTGDDAKVIVWDVRRREVRETLTGHSGRVHALAISPSGNTLFTAGLDSSVIVWDLGTRRRLVQRFRAGGGLEPSPPPLAVSPDGRTLAAGDQAGDVTLTDAASLRMRHRFRAHTGYVSAVEFSPDGRLLAVSGLGGTVSLWDARTRRRIARFRGLRQESQALGFSPDGRLLAAADGEGTVKVWDVAQRTQTVSFSGGRWVEDLAFSPDGRRVAVTFEDRGTQIRDVRGRRLATLPTTDAMRSVAFSPDGRLLATGQFDGETQLWSATSWRRVGRPLPRHAGFVLTVGFSPDGRTLATSSTDGTVRLWDVATRKPIGTPLPGRENNWASAVFSPDGAHLFAYYDRGDGFRWKISPAAWRRHACATAGRELTPLEWDDALPERPYRPVCRS